VEALKNAGADVFVDMAVGRYATEAIRKAYQLGWHPLQFVPNASLSLAAFIDPAGADEARGIVSNARSKGWRTAQQQADPAVHAFLDWMRTYNPDASLRDANNVYGYEVAQTLVEVLKSCGNDLSRDNVMKHAAGLDLTLGMLRPGIRITTSPTDYRPIKQLLLVRFNGQDWEGIGDITGD
jgi:branched-chain amino acid transport system substrate-binding protein